MTATATKAYKVWVKWWYPISPLLIWGACGLGCFLNKIIKVCHRYYKLPFLSCLIRWSYNKSTRNGRQYNDFSFSVAVGPSSCIPRTVPSSLVETSKCLTSSLGSAVRLVSESKASWYKIGLQQIYGRACGSGDIRCSRPPDHNIPASCY